ncbi:DUF6401 family natural product biosynthesis protein [Prauserella muralis]|nr:DUF6401 family natural product biosynthesis protein [Prauserella muralis]TWE13630.1 hypothetical protein FHX69_5754 [Prauserella muralis]
MADELATGWQALAQPALRRQFDQHLDSVVEAIRDGEALVERAVPTTQLVLIAGYAYDIRQQALLAGWEPPKAEADWAAGDWYGLRLLACYELASREPKGPRRMHSQSDWSSIVGLLRGSRPG